MSLEKISSTYSELKGTSLNTSSLLRSFNILKDDDSNYCLNIFKNFSINENILDDPTNMGTINIIEPWWDTLAYAYYNDVNLGWLLCKTNDVLNPFEDIDENIDISVLSKTFLPDIQKDMEQVFNL